MKLGVAFAGGGIRGAAHLGVLQALEEVGIKPDMYAGTSAGSIIATMKALGKTNEECLEVIKSASSDLIDVDYWGILKSMPRKFKTLEGVLKGVKLQEFLNHHIGDATLFGLEKNLAVISTDINSGAQIIFSSQTIGRAALSTIDDCLTSYGKYSKLPLSSIVYASCSLPGVFKPIEYNSHKLVDGSITNNLPSNVLKAMGANKVIAIGMSKKTEDKHEPKGIIDILGKSLDVLIGQNMFMSASQSEPVIHLSPNVGGIGLLDFNKVVDCYEIGLEYGRRVAPLVKEELERK